MGKPIDRNVIADLKALAADSDPTLVEQLVTMFADRAPKQISAIETGLRNADAKIVCSEAHTLKSSCANLGATEMAAICARIEEASRLGDLTAVAIDVKELRSLLPAVVAELNTLKKLDNAA